MRNPPDYKFIRFIRLPALKKHIGLQPTVLQIGLTMINTNIFIGRVLSFVYKQQFCFIYGMLIIAEFSLVVPQSEAFPDLPSSRSGVLRCNRGMENVNRNESYSRRYGEREISLIRECL